MAANATIIAPLQKRMWETQMTNQIILGSVFESLSNRMVKTAPPQNGDIVTVPDSVISYVSDKFDAGTMYVTIPALDKLRTKGVGGYTPADGSEENVSLRYARVFYNVKRKAVTFADGTVDGDAVSAYPILTEKVRLMGDYFAELNDYDKHRALILGADEFLTEASYWAAGNVYSGSAPVALKIHPNTFITGQLGVSVSSSLGAFSTSFTTQVQQLYANCNTTGVAARRFTKARLDGIVRYAKKAILPLNWKAGGQVITHVITLTQEAANQLQNDTTTAGAANWWATFSEAMEGKEVENRTVTNILGCYQGCLILVDPRGPLFNTVDDNTLAALLGYANWAAVPSTLQDYVQQQRFQMVKPWSDASINSAVTNGLGIDAGDNRVPAAKVDGAAGATSGTMEVCFVLGRTALGVAEVKPLKFTDDTKDYDFRKGFEARTSNGNMRMDFTNQNVAVTGWSGLTAFANNWSSAMFLVPTTNQVL